jgi:hypothetical protein
MLESACLPHRCLQVECDGKLWRTVNMLGVVGQCPFVVGVRKRHLGGEEGPRYLERQLIGQLWGLGATYG